MTPVSSRLTALPRPVINAAPHTIYHFHYVTLRKARLLACVLACSLRRLASKSERAPNERAFTFRDTSWKSSCTVVSHDFTAGSAGETFEAWKLVARAITQAARRRRRRRRARRNNGRGARGVKGRRYKSAEIVHSARFASKPRLRPRYAKSTLIRFFFDALCRVYASLCYQSSPNRAALLITT